MKNLIFLLTLVFLASSCYDNYPIGDSGLDHPKEEIEDQTEAEIEVASESIVFSDVVLDDDNDPLSNVVVSVYAAGKRYSDVTGATGKYVIEVPAAELPQIGYISLSITKDKYVPYNSTYKAPMQGGQVYETEEIQLRLVSCPNCLEIGEKSSELFHLGDDNYGGPENSQFQKTTDGTELDIELKDSDGYEKIDLSFEVKGIQPSRFMEENHSSVQFFAGDELVAEEFIDEDSPQDGSFGTYKMSVDNSETITIIKFVTRKDGPQDSDFDDWEFTCLYVESDN